MASFTGISRKFIVRGAGGLALAALLSATAWSTEPAPVISRPASVEPDRLVLQELWRIGGEDDDVFFGNVGNPTTDAEGNVYILDSQQSHTQVFSPDGELLSTLGREGDGPGEVRRPGDMYLAADGTVCMLQSMPGRIVKINPDGTPGGQLGYAVTAGTQAPFVVLSRGVALPDGIALAGINMTFGGSSVSQQKLFLDVCGPDGVRRTTLLQKEYPIDYADFVLDELSMDFVWTRLASGRDGKIYFAPERDAYEIRVHDSDGTLDRIVRCDYESVVRDTEQRKIETQIVEAIGAYYPTPPLRITIEDTEPDVTNLWVTDDGRLWVQSSRAELAPDGAWLVLDVFDTAGKLERRVALEGAHDPRADSVAVLGDGRVLVIKSSLAAFLNQQAVDQGPGAGDDDPLEIICYRPQN